MAELTFSMTGLSGLCSPKLAEELFGLCKECERLSM